MEDVDEATQPCSVEVLPVIVNTAATCDESLACLGVVERGEKNSLANGELHQEEESSLDEEFIKIEKESLDAKDSSHANKVITGSNVLPSTHSTLGSSVVNHDFLEFQEKMTSLVTELEKTTKELQSSESARLQLESDISLARDRLDERDKYCEELECSQKRLQAHINEVQTVYTSQLMALQEALETRDIQCKELMSVKDEHDGHLKELESLRMKIQDLNQELNISLNEAKKFEGLHKQSGIDADLEAQKALELERMLGLAKNSAVEMESQVAILQDELQGLYVKVAAYHNVEEALRNTEVQLTKVHADLEHSKSQVQELGRLLTSEKAMVRELTEQVDLHKASEDQLKKDAQMLENLFSSVKEDLHAKISNLEMMEAEFVKEIELRESIQLNTKNQEKIIANIQEKLKKVTGEKEALEEAVVERNANLSQLKEQYFNLELQLKASEENFCKTDGLLIEALSHNEQLEKQLNSLEVIQMESASIAARTSQRNDELEEVLRASNAAEEVAKAQQKETEIRLISVEQRNLELEEQKELVELRNNEAKTQLKVSREKIDELMDALRILQEENSQVKSQWHDYEDKIIHFESALSESTMKHYELEQELKSLAEKYNEQEKQMHLSHQHNFELENLIQISNSKAEDAVKKVAALEMLSKVAKKRVHELEEQISILEVQHGESKEESKKHLAMLYERETELSSLQAKVSVLEMALQASVEKEQELVRNLDGLIEEKKVLDAAASRSQENLSEAENLVEASQNELKAAEGRLEIVLKELEVTTIRETELREMLKSVKEQLEQQESMAEQAAVRSSELETLHQSLTKDMELRLQEAMKNFIQKDSEAKYLHEKVKSLDELVAVYKEQMELAAERETSLRGQIEEGSTKLAGLEAAVDEIKNKVMEAESKVEQSLSESELLAETNLELKQQLASHEFKTQELQARLNLVHTEKEEVCKQIASHLKTMQDLDCQKSVAVEARSFAESLLKEAEVHLQETVDKLAHRDRETKVLSEKLSGLEMQLIFFEQQSSDAAVIVERQKFELAEASRKLQLLEETVEELQRKSLQLEKVKESLAMANSELSQNRTALEAHIRDLEMNLQKILSEEEETLKQLHCYEKRIEVLADQLADEEKKVHFQVSSLEKEILHCTKRYEDACQEYQGIIAHMKVEMDHQKVKEEVLASEVAVLKAELNEKSVLQIRIAELEQQLLHTEARVVEEVESAIKVAADKEAIFCYKLEEQAKGLAEKELLDQRLTRLQEELNLAQITIREQRKEGTRDFRPSDRSLKSKQRTEVKQSAEVASAISTQIMDASPSVMGFKFIIGVALVSVLVGVILGKHY